MAEKKADQNFTFDKILECSLCHQQLRNPHRLQQCLHSFCKPCIEAVPQDTRDGKHGRPCPQCKTFSTVEEIQPDTFIDDLLNLHNAPICTDVANTVCKQCDTGIEATGKCIDCKIELCGKCQIAHFKIPMLKAHKITPLENISERVINKIMFCSLHEEKLLELNCNSCSKLICTKCMKEHDGHKIDTISDALERMTPNMETHTNQIYENIETIRAQIAGVQSKTHQVKESYASCRLEMDDHLEKVISRLRAMKAKVEDEVTEQESIALDTLDVLKNNLENQLTMAKHISQLASAVKDNCKIESLLKELNGGLYKMCESLGATKQQNIDFNIPEVNFTKSQCLESKFGEIVANVSFYAPNLKVYTTGDIGKDYDLCASIQDIFRKEFKNVLSIKLPGWASRISCIDNQIWVPLDQLKLINVYNLHGELVRRIDLIDKPIVVVKMVNNGDIIMGGEAGLFLLTEYSENNLQWIKLKDGQFSDIVVFGNDFLTVDHLANQILIFSKSEGVWATKKVLDLEYINPHTTAAVNADVIVYADVTLKKIFKYSTDVGFLDLVQLDGVPLICGSDNDGNVLVCNYHTGTLHIVDSRAEKLLCEEINSIKLMYVRDILFDNTGDMWALHGQRNATISLVKFK